MVLEAQKNPLVVFYGEHLTPNFNTLEVQKIGGEDTFGGRDSVFPKVRKTNNKHPQKIYLGF